MAAPWQPLNQPEDVTQSAADGYFYRNLPDPNGGQVTVRVCESCWQTMPRYIDFPQGLTSPDSDGDAGGNFPKVKATAVEGKEGWQHLQKAVCLPCYLEVFRAMYPAAPLPKLSPRLMGESEPYVGELDAAYVGVGEPK